MIMIESLSYILTLEVVILINDHSNTIPTYP
jgi:hypothetical protein